MKLNWGTGIALVYATFALGMVGAVFASRKHDPGLVSKNYYDLDLNYQQRMVEKQNAAALAKPLEINYLREQQAVAFQFPAEAGQPTGGSVKMFRGGTAEGEFSTPVKTDDAGLMQIPAEKLAAGRWHVEVLWEAAGRSFFQESTFFK